MALSRVEKPVLETASADYGNRTRNLNNRVLDLHHDATKLLGHARATKNTQIVHFYSFVVQLASDLTETPLSGDLRQAVEEIRQATLRVEKSVHDQGIVISYLPSTARWADAARHAPPPGTVLSSYGTGSSPAATLSELSKDREVIVKLGDADTVKIFCCLTSAEIKQQAEKARRKGARTDTAAILVSVQFVAAHQLKSGDLSLSLRNIKKAEIARCHRSWVLSLGNKATVRLPTWNVVIHNFPVWSVGDLTQFSEREQMIKNLLAKNIYT